MKIAIIGLGYVGVPLALATVNAGFEVLGYDTNAAIINELNAKSCHLNLWKEKFTRSVEPGKNAQFSSSPEILRHADVAIICVPTPLTDEYVPDHSYVEKAFKELGDYFNGHLIILESTVSPGYTRNLGKRYLGAKLLASGGKCSLCFSPEREDPGNELFSNVEIPKVIGGLTPECLEVGINLYARIFQHVAQATSLEAAEFCKVHENTFRAINISYVNQIRNLTAKLDVDFEEVINLAKTKPFGFMPFTSGVGVGGHCIPVDPYFLLKVADENQVDLSTIKAAMEEISVGPDDTAKWISTRVNDVQIAVSGAAYKDGVSDIRCSPAVQLLEILSQKYQVSFWDPNVSELYVNGDLCRSLSDNQFAEFSGAVIIVNNAGRKFVANNRMNATSIFDARYRKLLI